MSDIGSTKMTSLPVTPAASTKATLEQKTETESKFATDKTAKETAVLPADSAKKSKPEAVEKAIETVTSYVQSLGRDLQFSVDEELQQTVVKVVDSRSGELIRQIPDERFLELARKINEGGDFHLIDELT